MEDILKWSLRQNHSFSVNYFFCFFIYLQKVYELAIDNTLKSLSRTSLNTQALRYLFKIISTQKGIGCLKEGLKVNRRNNLPLRRFTKYLYRGVDKNGETVDFLLTAKRDRKAALRFFKKAIASCGTPIKINIAGIKDFNEKKKILK